MNTFILILTLCHPGVWNTCSGNQLRVERIENIPTLQACNDVKKQYEHVQNTEGGVASAICIPQSK